MPFNAGIKARIIGSISGQDCIQVLNFGVDVPWNVDTITVNDKLKELANAIHDCVVSTLIPAVCENYLFSHVECQAIWPNESDPVLSDLPGQMPGDLPAQGVLVASQLVELITGGGGRRGRGRNFWPPAGENHATGGNWEPAALALIAAFCACMAGKFIGAGKTTDYFLGVYSRTKDGELGQDFSTSFRPALQLRPSPRIATMGTRKVGRGS